jgi:hypothetical protein
MARWRKKPVEIDAHQWFKNGDHPDDYKNDIKDMYIIDPKPVTYTGDYQKLNNWEGQVVRFFRHPDVDGNSNCKHCQLYMFEHGWIDTLEGGHIVCPGDYIITGVEGERYPCKPGIFLKTYDPAESPKDRTYIWDELPEVIKAENEDFSEYLNDLKQQAFKIDNTLNKHWEEKDSDGRG